MCLANHTQPISHHITPLVINNLGGGHTDTQILLKKPGGRGPQADPHLVKELNLC